MKRDGRNQRPRTSVDKGRWRMYFKKAGLKNSEENNKKSYERKRRTMPA